MAMRARWLLLLPSLIASPTEAAFPAAARLRFEALGPGDSPARFLARASDGLVMLEDDAIVFLPGAGADVHGSGTGLAPEALRLRLLGVDPATAPIGSGPPGETRSGRLEFTGARYHSVYPGVDLVCHGGGRDGGQLEYDFELAPGADIGAIRVRIEGPGAGSARLDERGDLVLRTASGVVRHQAPIVLQRSAPGTAPRRIAARQVLAVDASGAEIGFEVTGHDPGRALLIDPVLSFSTFLGGSDDEDAGYAVGLDAAGNSYVTGGTRSADFPVVGPVQGNLAGAEDAFVTKFNPSGTAPVYSTFVGGSFDDSATVIAVDAQERAWITGTTESTDFPVVAAFQPSPGGGFEDAVVVGLGPAGDTLVVSSYLGGGGDESGFGIASGGGRIYVTGGTDSPDFPLRAPAQPALAAGSDAFVTAVDPVLGLVYSSYLGGVGDESGLAIAVGSAGDASIAGSTDSPDFPTRSELQSALLGPSDAFVARFDAAGSIVFSTFLGGRDVEEGLGIAIAASGAIQVCGSTHSTDFPTANPHQPALAGLGDAFIAVLAASGSPLLFASYLGGSEEDSATGLAVARDGSGAIVLVGSTSSADFPILAPFQDRLPGRGAAFAAWIEPTGAPPAWSTYLGGSEPFPGANACYGIAVDAAGSAWITGMTEATDFPTLDPVQPALAGGRDGFLTRLCPAAAGSVSAVGNTLEIVKEAAAGLRLHWQDVAPASSYSIYADLDGRGSFPLRAGSATSGSIGFATAGTAAAIDYFRVAPALACGEGSK